MSTAFISVRKKPGAMPLTWILCGASSTASARVNCFSPPLLTAYGTMFGRPRSLASEQMFTILPARRAFIPGSTACVTWNGPSRFAAIRSCQSASANVSSGPRLLTAALFTRISTAPATRSNSAMPARDGSAVGDVEWHDTHLETVGRKPCSRRFQLVDVASIERDARTCPRQSLRDREPQAAAAAGDQRDAAGKIELRCPPSPVTIASSARRPCRTSPPRLRPGARRRSAPRATPRRQTSAATSRGA